MPLVSELTQPLTTFAFAQLHHPAAICCAAAFYRSLPHHAKDRERKTRRRTSEREEGARERGTQGERPQHGKDPLRARQTSRNRHGETCVRRRYAAAPAAGTTSAKQTPSGRPRISDAWAICRHRQRSRRQDHDTNAAFPNQTSALRRADVKGHSNLRRPLAPKANFAEHARTS